jgi:hypothetical protein
MKKFISFLILSTALTACEIRPAPVRAIVVVESQICEPAPSDLRWASYCDGECCYEEYYDGPWLCEEAWCYDYYYCGWEYMGDLCY